MEPLQLSSLLGEDSAYNAPFTLLGVPLVNSVTPDRDDSSIGSSSDLSSTAGHLHPLVAYPLVDMLAGVDDPRFAELIHSNVDSSALQSLEVVVSVIILINVATARFSFQTAENVSSTVGANGDFSGTSRSVLPLSVDNSPDLTLVGEDPGVAIGSSSDLDSSSGLLLPGLTVISFAVPFVKRVTSQHFLFLTNGPYGTISSSANRKS